MSFKYNVYGPIQIRQCGMYEESNYDYDFKDASYSIKRALKETIESEKDNLANYLDESQTIYGVVTSIIVGVNDEGSLTEVEAIRELDENEIFELLNDIGAQFSDGWGEGFEQREIYRFDEDVELYDEDEEDYYTENDIIDVYASFWNRYNFNLTIEKV